MEDNMSVTGPVIAEEPDEEDAFDEEWVSTTRRRSRWRLVLVVSLALALTFLGGVLVQKQFGAESTTAAASGFPSGLPTGGFPGGAIPGGTGDTGSGAGAPDGGGGQTGGADTTAAVIGTVVSIDGDVWTVKDLGGTEHQITVPATASVTKEQKIAASDVAVGTTVDVSGTTADSGELTASQITVR